MVMQKDKKKRGKKLVEKMLGALIVGGALLQAPHCANNVVQQIAPSTLRQEFQKQYGITLVGWPQDIEEEPERIQEINQALVREKYEQDFKLNRIRLRPKEVFKMPLVDMVTKGVVIPIAGYYNGFTKTVLITPEGNRATAHHEIKHAKTFALLR